MKLQDHELHTIISTLRGKTVSQGQFSSLRQALIDCQDHQRRMTKAALSAGDIVTWINSRGTSRRGTVKRILRKNASILADDDQRVRHLDYVRDNPIRCGCFECLQQGLKQFNTVSHELHTQKTQSLWVWVGEDGKIMMTPSVKCPRPMIYLTREAAWRQRNAARKSRILVKDGQRLGYTPNPRLIEYIADPVQ